MSIVIAQAQPSQSTIGGEIVAIEEVEIVTSASLTSLPTELQHHVFLLLHPIDVISVGSTCWELFHSINNRELWIQIRRQVDVANSTFICHGHEDISLRQLKHAATSPARMLGRLRQFPSKDGTSNDETVSSPTPMARNSDVGIVPVRKTMFKPKSRAKIVKMTSCLFLIPGGRLLVTSIGDRLSICDLEGPDQSPTVLVSKTCSPGFIFLITPSKDRTSFNIAASMNESHEKTMLYIYTYSSSRPNVLHTAKTQLEVHQDYDISVFTLIHNLFVYLHKGNIHVWNYVENRFSSWNVPATFNRHIFPEMFVYEERQIIVIGERIVVGWDIPPLLTQKEYQSNLRGRTTLLGTLEPVFSIDLSTLFNAEAVGIDTPIRPAFVEKAYDWYSVFSPPQAFDIVWTTGDGEYDYFTTIGLKEPDQPNGPFTAELGSTIKILSLAVPHTTELDGDRCLDSWRVCESKLVKGYHRRDGRRFEIVISAADCHHCPSFTSLGSFAAGEDLAQSEDFDRFRFSFDAISGRACYMSKSHQKVVVVDYIGIDPRPVYADHTEFMESIGLISL